MPAVLVDRVSNLLREIGREAKVASTKTSMDDPGGMDGKSSHPSVMPESKANEQAPTEKEQTADNTSIVKDTIPNSVDAASPVTPTGAPKDTDVQIGNATPTGEDPANEDDYKGTKEDGSIGGATSHPANGSLGDKYASLTRESLTKLSDDELYKAAAELGNELAADVANGHFNAPTPVTAAATKPALNKAAAAGYQAAAAAASEEELDKLAASVIEETVLTAHWHAGLVAAYVKEAAAKLSEDADDPAGGSAEGEDHGSDAPPPDHGGGGGGPPPDMGGGGGGGGDPLLAAMGGGGGDPAAAAGGMPPPGGIPGAGGGGAGGPPPEMAGMGQEQGLQHLAMALLELGIDPSMLASAGGGGGGAPGGAPPGPGPELAAKVASYKASGRFHFAEAKTAADRKIRDWMKGFVRELVTRK